MKIPKARLLLLCVSFLQFSVSRSQGKDGSLLAAPYPGSVPETYPTLFSPSTKAPVESRLRIFYTKDPVEMVKAHYTKTLGEFSVSPMGDNIYQREVIPYREVWAFLEKKGVMIGEADVGIVGGEFAGITLYGKLINSTYSVTKAIDKLKSAYMLRFSGLEVEDVTAITKHIEDAELKQTVARYEHVLWEYFPMTKEKRMDEVLFDKYITGPEEALTKEQKELVKKMTELSTARKYDEAGKVGDRMMELMKRQSDPKWNWDNAIKCLQEMEKNAYATKIVIDKHPSQWDLTGASFRK